MNITKSLITEVWAELKLKRTVETSRNQQQWEASSIHRHKETKEGTDVLESSEARVVGGGLPAREDAGTASPSQGGSWWGNHSNPSLFQFLPYQGVRMRAMQSIWVSIPRHKAGQRREKQGSLEEVISIQRKTV